MIGLVTDSGAHLPSGIAGATPVEVVPLTVTIGDLDYLEGITLDPEHFHAVLAAGTHEITVSAPSPGQFAAAYETLLDAGCTQVLSLHATNAPAGTVQAARRGGHSVPLPVHVIEVATAGFGVACCMRVAAESVAAGASLEEVTAAVNAAAASLATVFVEAGGAHAHQPQVTVRTGTSELVERLDTAADAVNASAAHALRAGASRTLWVGIGHTDGHSSPLADALDAALSEVANVRQVIRYRIGAGHGIHRCPGTAGCFVLPLA